MNVLRWLMAGMVVLGMAAQESHPHTTFFDWRTCKPCAEALDQEVAARVRESQTPDGLDKSLRALRQRLESRPGMTSQELAWTGNLWQRLEYRLMHPDVPAELLRPEPSGPTSDLNRFRTADSLQVEELAIPDDSPSQVAREVWTCGTIAYRLVWDGAGELRRRHLEGFQTARQNWAAFRTHAMADAYPWESYTNAACFPGTLARPPGGQLRYLHPFAASLVSPRSRVTLPVLAVELLGFRRYSPSTWEPTWGLSLFATPKAAENRKEAFGLLVSFRDFSLGLTAPQRIEGRRESQLILGIKLTRLIQARRERFRSL
jgi:hypothetical protein